MEKTCHLLPNFTFFNISYIFLKKSGVPKTYKKKRFLIKIFNIFRLENEEEEGEDEEEVNPEYNRRKVLVNNTGIPEKDSEGELIDQDYCAKMYLKVGIKYFQSL